MSKTAVTVEFGKGEISCLIDFLVDDLRVWSEKGFESRREKEQFQRIVSVVSYVKRWGKLLHYSFKKPSSIDTKKRDKVCQSVQ